MDLKNNGPPMDILQPVPYLHTKEMTTDFYPTC